MDAHAFFDLGTVLTGLLLGAVLLYLGAEAPKVRAMTRWLAAAYGCEAATGAVVLLSDASGATTTVFLLSALHGLVPALMLVGLRTLAPATAPAGLPTLMVAAMLIWLGVATSAAMPMSSILAPVHGFRAVLYLACAWVLWRGTGPEGRPALVISLLSAMLAVAAGALLLTDRARLEDLRGAEEALTFGLALALTWIAVHRRGDGAGPFAIPADDAGASLLDDIEEGLIRVDRATGRITWANLYARRLLGDAPGATLAGTPWAALFPSLAGDADALDTLPRRDVVPDADDDRDGTGGGLGLNARSLGGRAIPVVLLSPPSVARTQSDEGVVLIRAQRRALPPSLSRLSLEIDARLLAGDPPDALCRLASRRVAELESVPLVWIALGAWHESLTLTAVGGPAAPILSDHVGKPLPDALVPLVEPTLGAGRARIVAGGLPWSPDRAAVAEGEEAPPGLAGSASTGLFPILGGNRTLGVLVIHTDTVNVSEGMVARFDVLARRLGTSIRFSQDTAFLRLQAAAMSVAANAIFITDHQGHIEWVNEAFVRMSGFSARELTGKTPHILFSGQQEEAVYADLWNTIRRGNVWRGELVERRKDGSLYTVQQTVTPMRGPDDDAPHYVAVHEDITDRKRAEERIRYLSNYDTLTRLPNRTLFRDRLNQAVQQAHWTGGTVAVLFMDLTQFSRVNDTLGHDLGDQILMTVGSRINAAVADEVDVVARMGGDEFALIQGGHHGTEAAAGLARRLARIIQTPVEIGDQSVSLRATIGIAMYPEDGTNPDNLIKNADLAMHRASRAEGEPYCFFSTEMNNEAQTRLNLEGDLRRALERAELVNFYQPQYDMNGSLVGMEALVRWRHPTRGLVPPGQFIPAAEDSGLIGPLGDMVLRNAASDIARWRGLGLPAIPVAVNISAVQFRDAGLVKRILSVLDDHGLGPDAIDLELTESILMGEQAGAVSFLNQLAAEGFRIAIDDFGTGYSSLSYLKRFPVHKLKIDQSFVQHLHEDTNDAILVRAIINLGHSLAMTVVAEGVETEDQFTYLRDEGADVVQGYLFSKPVPSEEMESLLRVESGHLEIAPGSGTR